MNHTTRKTLFQIRALPRLALLLVACLLLAACGSTPRYVSPAPVPAQGRGQEIVRTARTVLGTPYAYGGASPRTGFDCSGLAFWAFSVNGAAIPRSSRDQMFAGNPVDPQAIQPGDLVFFDVDGSPHVGIYAGQGAFIHSPKTGGAVREEDIYKDFWRRRFVLARRVF